MASFTSLSAFAAHLTSLVVHVENAKHQALEEAAKVVEAEAKRVIGTYDYGWKRLAPSTLARKAADTPLLETGEMRESIKHHVEWNHDRAHIGSNNDKAVWHELGTSRVPPRPFLLGAAVHKEAEVRRILGDNVVKALTKG